MTKKELYPYLLVFIGAVGYGTLAIFGRLADGRGLDLLTLLGFRFGIASLFLWILSFYFNVWKIKIEDRIRCLLIGFFGDALQTFLFFLL